MKKVLFLIPTLGGGGAEKVLVNLVNNMDHTKYDITVKTLFPGGVNVKGLRNVKYEHAFKHEIRGHSHFMKILSPKMLYKMVVKEKYDCIISYLEGITTRILAGCCDDTKLISWLHTSKTKDFVGCFRNYKEMINTYNKCSKIIGVSEDVINSFNNYTKDILNNKTMVIKNVVDFNSIVSLANEEVTLSSDVFRIICIGRLTKIKDFDRMLHIMSKLNKDFDNLELIILGTGEEENNLKDAIKELSLNNVHLLGYQDNPYKYLAKSNLYVCSSHFEGFSTTTNEALILNIPIVTTNCAGMQDLLDNGKCGIIVDDNDEELYKGIKTIIEDSDLRNNIISNQNIKAKKLYEDVCKNIKEVEDII